MQKRKRKTITTLQKELKHLYGKLYYNTGVWWKVKTAFGRASKLQLYEGHVSCKQFSVKTYCSEFKFGL